MAMATISPESQCKKYTLHMNEYTAVYSKQVTWNQCTMIHSHILKSISFFQNIGTTH